MKASSEIPRPAGSLVNHTRRFVKDTMKFYEEAFRECGDVFATRIPGLGEWVYVCSPELVEAMLEAPTDVLAAGELNASNTLSQVLGPDSTSNLDGDAHRERRDAVRPYLDLQGSLRHVDDVREIAAGRIAEWPLGRPFPLVKRLQRIALEALVKMIFSAADPEKTRQLAELYETFSFKGLRSPTVSHPSLRIDLGALSPWGRVVKRQRAVTEAFSREIATRLEALDEPQEDDFLLGLARAQFTAGGRLTQKVILTEILDLLFQSHEMTGNSVTWILSEVLRHPEVLARLREELDSVVGQEGIGSSHLADLPYLEAVVYEGLRFRPTVPFTSVRQVKQPFPLAGYLLPEGTMLALCYPALARREDIFANAGRFDPENFYGKKPEDFAWYPFGGGPHACMGKDLAVVMMKVVLATVVRKAELELAQEEIRPVRNAYYYEPVKGLLVTLEKHL